MSASRPEHVRPTTAQPARSWLRWLIPLVLVLAAAGGVGLVTRLPKAEPPKAPPEVRRVNVTAQVVEALPELADTMDLTAVVEPNRIVRVAAEVSSQIEDYGQRQQAANVADGVPTAGQRLDEGEPVVAGQAIILLNRDLLSARHERAAAQFDYDEREFRRIQELFERGATSRTELEDARTRRDLSKASLDEATRELERTIIKAPLAGMLNRLPKEVGEYVTPGDEVAEIVELDPVKVAVDVPERDVHYLEPGHTATVLVRSHEDVRHEGRITYIASMADPGTRTSRVEITIPNSDRRLRSGQIVRARLTRRVLRDVIMVPLEAVIPLESGRLVFVVENGVAVRRDVELGILKGHSIQVLRGLSPGDRLIIAGHRYVGPGQLVTEVPPMSAGDPPTGADPQAPPPPSPPETAPSAAGPP